MHIELWFRTEEKLLNGYECSLIPTAEDLLVFEKEAIYFHDQKNYNDPFVSSSSTKIHDETILEDWKHKGERVAYYVLKTLRSWQLYHFHDTSESAKVKQMGDINDNLFFLDQMPPIWRRIYICCGRQNQTTTATSWKQFTWPLPSLVTLFYVHHHLTRKRFVWSGKKRDRICYLVPTRFRMVRYALSASQHFSFNPHTAYPPPLS